MLTLWLARYLLRIRLKNNNAALYTLARITGGKASKDFVEIGGQQVV
jgi:hypothetical protein